ncbi:MAG: hypothetical protein ILO34_04625 [Kiritimatiellae bacterium]|nr:hypothetical protein [Kiritimatiellia bacterium]
MERLVCVFLFVGSCSLAVARGQTMPSVAEVVAMPEEDFWEAFVCPIQEEHGAIGTLNLASYFADGMGPSFADSVKSFNAEKWKAFELLHVSWTESLPEESEIMALADYLGSKQTKIDFRQMNDEYREAWGTTNKTRNFWFVSGSGMPRQTTVTTNLKARAVSEKWNPLIWRTQYGKWCRRRLLEMFSDTIRRYADTLAGDDRDRFREEFAQRTKMNAKEKAKLSDVEQQDRPTEPGDEFQ